MPSTQEWLSVSESSISQQIVELDSIQDVVFLISQFHGRFFVRSPDKFRSFSESEPMDSDLAETYAIKGQAEDPHFVFDSHDLSSNEGVPSLNSNLSDQTKRQQKPAARNSKMKVDILVITALTDEYEAFSRCAEKVIGEKPARFKTSQGQHYRLISFKNNQGKSFKIAVASPHEMGALATATLATDLTKELSPKILAMTGICAGRKGKVNLGDIIVAERVFEIDRGKVVAEYNEIGGGKFQRDENFWGDYKSYNLNAKIRSTICEYSKHYCEKVSQYIKDHHPKGEKAQPLEIHVGVIGTTGQVQEDARYFDSLKKVARNTIAIEMEGASIGDSAFFTNIPMILVKAVSDFGAPPKNDRFRDYAAEASATFLLVLLQEEYPFSL
jgi:nucleoside phosphorylase